MRALRTGLWLAGGALGLLLAALVTLWLWAGTPGSLAQVVNAAIANKGRFDAMSEFFAEVGAGDRAGVWEGVPQLRPEFRADTRRHVIKVQKRLKAEQMV